NRKFITAEPRNGIRRPCAGQQPHRDSSQQYVSGAVSKRIVDRLELIEVEHKNREPFSESLDPCGGLLESLQEQKPVGEPGQGILPGLYLQPLAGPLESYPIPQA